jgi:hypothetical protein
MKPSLTLLLSAATSLVVGCASVSMKPSGFLKNYDELKPAKPGTPALAYRNPTTTSRYHAVIIEPVGFSSMAAAKLNPVERQRLGEDLTERTRAVFATKYQLVNGPGPGTLRLRIAVNDINKSSPVVNMVTTVAAFVPMDMGAVSVEMEAIDSRSGRRIAALLDQRQELPLGPKGFFGSFSPTGNVKSGFTRLAEEMLKLLAAPAGNPTREK